jgi:long-chain acyl-CoA synthetase
MRQGDNDDLWFVSRKKDVIVRGGLNISPIEIEHALTAHPAVRDAAVVGVPDVHSVNAWRDSSRWSAVREA